MLIYEIRPIAGLSGEALQETLTQAMPKDTARVISHGTNC